MKNYIKKNFTIIPNELIKDKKLTDRARFMFCYMCSMPDDWVFYQHKMANDLGYSIDTVRKYLSELINSGWISREEKRDNGKFDSFEYVLYDVPVTKNTDTENNRVGKIPTRQNSALNNTIKITKKEKEQIKTINIEKQEIESVPDPISEIENNSNSNENLHILFAKKILDETDPDGCTHRESLEYQTKEKITKQLTKEFRMHLITEHKEYKKFSEWIRHFRNWLNTRPKATTSLNRYS